MPFKIVKQVHVERRALWCLVSGTLLLNNSFSAPAVLLAQRPLRYIAHLAFLTDKVIDAARVYQLL